MLWSRSRCSTGTHARGGSATRLRCVRSWTRCRCRGARLAISRSAPCGSGSHHARSAGRRVAAAGRVQVARGLKFTVVVAAFEVAVHLTVRPASLSPQVMTWLETAAMTVMTLSIARMMGGLLAWRRWPRWVARRRWIGSLSTPEIVFWFAALLVCIAWRHAESVPPYVREPAHVFLSHLQPLIWLQFLVSDRPDQCACDASCLRTSSAEPVRHSATRSLSVVSVTAPARRPHSCVRPFPHGVVCRP